MALFLFFIRLSDDICDIPIDQITHPDRLLCSGEISLKEINRFRFSSVIIMLALQIPNLNALFFLTLTIGLFLLFFKVKPVLPVLLHTTILNFSLFIFPVYTGYLFCGEASSIHVLIGLFFWLGGLAHDYSHCLIDSRGQRPESLNPINRINQHYLAWLSLLLFTSATGVGLYIIVNQWVTPGFTIGLTLMSATILLFEYKLIKSPNETTAKPFYVGGFIFFLLPALLNVIFLFAIENIAI